MNQSTLNEAIARFKAETPIFFKKVIGIGLGLLSFGAAIKGIDQTPLAVKLPAILDTVANYAVTAGTVAAAVAKFAKVDVNADVQQSK